MHKNITIIKQKEHRLELAFVITFHKLQGKTLPNLIIELNGRPFSPSITYNGFFVALSRVTHRSLLRIMPITPGTDIQYLKKSKPDNYLEIWLGGLDNNGTWDEKICKQYYNHKISIHENEKIRNSKFYEIRIMEILN